MLPSNPPGHKEQKDKRTNDQENEGNTKQGTRWLGKHASNHPIPNSSFLSPQDTRSKKTKEQIIKTTRGTRSKEQDDWENKRKQERTKVKTSNPQL